MQSATALAGPGHQGLTAMLQRWLMVSFA